MTDTREKQSRSQVASEARQLAALLTDKHAIQFTITWCGRRTDWWGGWHVIWIDGPTEPEIRTVIKGFTDETPRITRRSLRYERNSTPLAEATALLMYLDDRPSELAYLDSWLPDFAHDRTSYPERAPRIWEDRARRLMTVGNGTSLDDCALDQLREHAGRNWQRGVAWLDSIQPLRVVS